MEKDDWLRMLKCAEVDAQDKAAVDHVMLRYRPIAPKPAVAVPARVGDDASSVFAKRRKRKYVRVCKKNNNGRSRNKGGSSSLDLDGVKEIVTLQLLPGNDGEFDDLKEESPPSSSGNQERTVVMDTITTRDGDDNMEAYFNLNRLENPTAEIHQRVVESWLTVESVTASACCTYGVSDVEIMEGFDKDTCPCFVSDGWNRVVWVNDAYKKMVGGNNGGTPDLEFAVRLTAGETTAFWRTFTCRVKVQYTWQDSKISKTMPCDVMKMEFGGFAWRLDAKAALSLGL